MTEQSLPMKLILDTPGNESQDSGCAGTSGGSTGNEKKRMIIDLDEYEDEEHDESSKTKKQFIEVKIEKE